MSCRGYQKRSQRAGQDVSHEPRVKTTTGKIMGLLEWRKNKLAYGWVRVRQFGAVCRLKDLYDPKHKQKYKCPSLIYKGSKYRSLKTRVTNNTTPGSKIKISNKKETSYRGRTLALRSHCGSVTPLLRYALLCDVKVPRRSIVPKQPQTTHFA